MKYQIGEVIRFESLNYELNGKLATITACKPYGDGSHGDGHLYQTAVTGDRWIHEDWLKPVNGGMPKSTKESTSDSMTFEQFFDHIRSVDEAIFERCYRAMEEEDRRRDQEQQRKLAGAIASAMDAYLQKVGDNRDIYLSLPHGVCGTVSMQDMYDAIVNEFDLTAQ
jgi:hypothetical protein